jgi:hypothetical protein
VFWPFDCRVVELHLQSPISLFQVHQQESDSKELPDLQVLKKPKLDSGLDSYSAYLYPVADPSNHILWYESWARMSAFRPWPALLAKEGKGQPLPPPVMRDR